MTTEIERLDPKNVFGYCVVNDDGKVWRTVFPKDARKIAAKYNASIPDKRIDHCSFESFGWHRVWADTIDELIRDIKSLDVPYYSDDVFLNELIKSDRSDTRNDRQVELYFDGRGTKITRGALTLNNMTDYTSF